MEQNRYINKFIKVYPILKGFTDDLLFFIAIDTLFFTVVKGLSAQQIVLLTTISSLFSLVTRILFVRVIEKLGNTKSVKFGMGLLLLSSIIITFGKTYTMLMLGKFIYEMAWVFKDMENVMLKNNLKVIEKPEMYAKIANKGMVVYAFLTLIVSLTSGFLFKVNPYLPMYLCMLICIGAFLIYLGMKDVSKDDIVKVEKKEKSKLKLSKIIWVILLSYTLFYGCTTIGQQNGKLLIQYELTNFYGIDKVSIYLGIIVAISRLSRLMSSIIFGKVYNKTKDKSLIILVVMLLFSFVFMTAGFNIPNEILKIVLMSIGFCLILAARDPFRLYTNDIVLKRTSPEQQKRAISYVSFGRKVGTTIWGFVASAILLKWQIIHVIIATGFLATIEVYVGLKLYSMLEINKLKKVI